MVDYPPTCLRGIPNKGPQYYSNTGEITGYVFRPHSEEAPNTEGWYEISINWEDDDTVEEITLHTTGEDGDIKFKGGLARVGRDRLDKLINRDQFDGFVNYERAPKKENPYHGNILLHKNKINDSKSRRRAFFGVLADIIIIVIPTD